MQCFRLNHERCCYFYEWQKESQTTGGRTQHAGARYGSPDIETRDDVFLEPSAFRQTYMSHTTMTCVPTFVVEREEGCDNFTLPLLTLDSPCGTLPNHVYGKMVKFNALSRYGPRK